MKKPTESFDPAAAQALGEPVVASLVVFARNWRVLASTQSAPLVADVVLKATLPGPAGEILGKASELALEKGLELGAERREERDLRDGEYHGAKHAWMTLGEKLYLVVTPTRFGIYHLGGVWQVGLRQPALLAPREAVVRCELTGGHLVYFPLTLDLAVDTIDGVRLRFGLAALWKQDAARLQAALAERPEHAAAPQPAPLGQAVAPPPTSSPPPGFPVAPQPPASPISGSEADA
jgi:hypothetical protein